MTLPLTETVQLSTNVEQAVEQVIGPDIHTHFYAPTFGELLSLGIDDLLVYHYLVTEGFRHCDLP